MTPEEAREILARTDHAKECRDSIGDLTFWYDYEAGEVIEGTQAALDAADRSMEMLEQIFRMTWEYAVRIDFGTGSRLYVRPWVTTRYADCALWRSNLDEACKIADKARTLYLEPVHIIRRLVTAPEVSP